MSIGYFSISKTRIYEMIIQYKNNKSRIDAPET